MYIKQHKNADDEIWNGYCDFVKYSYFHNIMTYDFSPFFDKDDKFLDIYGLKIPRIEQKDVSSFWYEFPDLVLPYKLEVDGHKYEFDRIHALINEGPYELNDHVSVNENDVVIDCGANIGLFSAIAAQKNAICYAFEPSSTIINHYTQLMADANGNIIVCPYALGSKKGTAFFETNSMQMANSKLANLQTGENACEEVPITTLDDFVKENSLNRVDFIKSDIEGAEREMLKGAKNTLKEFAPKLSICTYHMPDDKEVLESLILDANSKYKIIHAYKKLYAYV